MVQQKVGLPDQKIALNSMANCKFPQLGEIGTF